ncbi:MAG: hypothetical protein ACQEQF_09795 [Bacillota bacterium]
MTKTERKRYAKEVIKKMWGTSVSYSDKDLTPELCNWVIEIYFSFTAASPTTSISEANWETIKSLRDLLRKNISYKDWDPEVKIKARTYKNNFQTAVDSGNTDHLPELQIRTSKK